MTSDDLVRRGEMRWEQIRAERPDLEAAIELQRTLVVRIIEVGEAIEQGRLADFSVPPTQVSAKLARGVPFLRGESIALPRSLLSPLLQEFCGYLGRGGAGDVADHIKAALESGQIDSGSLLAASLARDQHAIRTTAIHMGLAPDLVWLVAELAVGPLAHALLRRVVTDHQGKAAESSIADALVGWDRGYCPACGSWPALAEVCRGDRALRCSFCGAQWQLRTYRCTYCNEAGESFVTAAPDSERPWRRLELCRSCHGYLKGVGVSDPTPFPLLPIEDLATTDLDLAAMERGYARPSLRDIGDLS